jgi:hypothetical protein
MSSTPVVIKLECDLKETQTNHVRSKLSEILKVYLKNMLPEKKSRQSKYRTIQISVTIIDFPN